MVVRLLSETEGVITELRRESLVSLALQYMCLVLHHVIPTSGATLVSSQLWFWPDDDTLNKLGIKSLFISQLIIVSVDSGVVNTHTSTKHYLTHKSGQQNTPKQYKSLKLVKNTGEPK